MEGTISLGLRSARIHGLPNSNMLHEAGDRLGQSKPTRTMNCPQCQAPMKDGYILPEYGDDLWFDRKPEDSLFKFLHKLKPRQASSEVQRIGAHRCPDCKRLERAAP